MNFRPDLAHQVITGAKTVTRRLTSTNPRSPWWEGGCSLKPGRDYAVCPGRGTHAIGRALVTSVTLERLGHLDDAEARREGFPDAAAFEAGFAAINGSYDPDVQVWVIRLQALPDTAQEGRP